VAAAAASRVFTGLIPTPSHARVKLARAACPGREAAV
jgi:hypothetical protein